MVSFICDTGYVLRDMMVWLRLGDDRSRFESWIYLPGPHTIIEFCAYSAPNFSTAASILVIPL